MMLMIDGDCCCVVFHFNKKAPAVAVSFATVSSNINKAIAIPAYRTAITPTVPPKTRNKPDVVDDVVDCNGNDQHRNK